MVEQLNNNLNMKKNNEIPRLQMMNLWLNWDPLFWLAISGPEKRTKKVWPATVP
jgi:hypothetical protein